MIAYLTTPMMGWKTLEEMFVGAIQGPLPASTYLRHSSQEPISDSAGSFPIHSWVDLLPRLQSSTFLGIRLFLLLCLISFNPWMEEVSGLNNAMSGSRRCKIVEGDLKGRVASLVIF